MSDVKDTLIGIGLAMIILYFVVILVVAEFSRELSNIVTEFGLLFAGVITLLFSATVD